MKIKSKFGDALEDYLATREEIDQNIISKVDLAIGFLRQLTIQLWSISYLRFVTGLLVLLFLEPDTFLDAAFIFALTTVYCGFPVGQMFKLVALIRMTLLLQFSLERFISSFDLIKIVSLMNPSLVFILSRIFILLSFYVVIKMVNLYLSNSSNSMAKKGIVSLFYLSTSLSFYISRLIIDDLLLGWLSFGVLVIVITNVFMLGVGSPQLAENKSK